MGSLTHFGINTWGWDSVNANTPKLKKVFIDSIYYSEYATPQKHNKLPKRTNIIQNMQRLKAQQNTQKNQRALYRSCKAKFLENVCAKQTSLSWKNIVSQSKEACSNHQGRLLGVSWSCATLVVWDYYAKKNNNQRRCFGNKNSNNECPSKKLYHN
jgi:hypothetical protein